MKATRDVNGDWIVDAGALVDYKEIRQAEPTSRVLSGSSDHGYDAEYIGYGNIHGIPVKVVYLLTDDDMCCEGGEPYDDQGDYDWKTALEQGRIIVDIDELTETQYNQLLTTGEITNA